MEQRAERSVGRRPVEGRSGALRRLLPERIEWSAAWRSVRREPLLSATVVVALATGIAIATAGFTLLAQVAWGELPFPDGERWVRLRAFTAEGERGEIESDRLRFLRAEARSFELLGAVATAQLPIALPNGAIEVAVGSTLEPGWFARLPYAPVAGRLLVEADGAPGAEPVALIAERFWRRRMGGAPDAVGSTIEVGGQRRTIVGVLPDAAGFPARDELWLAAPADAITGPGARVVGVLASGVALEAAELEVELLSERFDAARAITAPPRLALRRAADLSGSGLDVAAALFQGLLLLVLLLIASNVGNLVRARAAAREGELAVRSALGASRARLARQLALELALLGGAAGLVGLGMSAALTRAVSAVAGDEDLPFWFDFTPRASTLLFVLLASAVGFAFAGLLPALRATRAGASSGWTGARAAGGGSRLASLWIAVEMAVSVALVVLALALARGGATASAGTGALPVEQLATARISLTPAEQGGRTTLDELLGALRALPGVEAAGAASSLPLLSAAAERIEIEPIAGEPPGEARRAPVVEASTGFLEALTGEAAAGRLFAAGDFSPGAAPVAIVNQPFVERELGGRAPLGRRLRIGGEGPWREIVGVVPDLGLGAGDPRMAAGLYLPFATEPGFTFLVLRGAGGAEMLAQPARRALFELDPTLALRKVGSLAHAAAEDRAALTTFASVLAFVGAISLLLSALGIYAAVSYRVARRTREIGVRVALGATEGQVARLVVSGTAKLFAVGATAGVLLASALLSVREAVLVARFPGPGLWVGPAVALLLGAAALAACWVPVRRALAIEPAGALRAE